MTGLAAVNDDVDHLAVLVLGLRQYRRADGVQVPDVVGDVLEVPLVRALVEIDGDHRVGVQVVAGTDRAIQVRRRIADDEEYGARLLVDRRRHPHAAAQRLVELAVLFGKRLLFRGDVAVHVATGRVVDGPHAFVARLRDRVERPQQLAVGRVERLDEAANAVLAAVGADQHLAVDDRRRHRFRVALFRIGDLRFPQQLAGLGVERDELGVDRAHEQLAAFDRDAAVVVAAADRDDRAELVLVVPEFLAGHGVDRVDVVERRRQEHHAIDDDGRGFHRLQHGGLEDERRLHLADVSGVDLAPGVVARLIVAAVRVDPVLGVAAGCIEHRLRYRRACGHGLGRRRRTARTSCRSQRRRQPAPMRQWRPLPPAWSRDRMPPPCYSCFASAGMPIARRVNGSRRLRATCVIVQLRLRLQIGGRWCAATMSRRSCEIAMEDPRCN